MVHPNWWLLSKHSYQRCLAKSTLYIKVEGSNFLTLSLYVDDIIITSTFDAMIDQFKNVMISEFEMSDLGEVNYFLGLKFKQSSCGILITQSKYVEDLLAHFKMQNCILVDTPTIFKAKLLKEDSSPHVDATMYRSLIGSLMYLTTTRPNIMFDFNKVA